MFPGICPYNIVLLSAHTAASPPSIPLPTPSFHPVLEISPPCAQTLLKSTIPLRIAASFLQNCLTSLQDRRRTTVPSLHWRALTLPLFSLRYPIYNSLEKEYTNPSSRIIALLPARRSYISHGRRRHDLLLSLRKGPHGAEEGSRSGEGSWQAEGGGEV